MIIGSGFIAKILKKNNLIKKYRLAIYASAFLIPDLLIKIIFQEKKIK
jgi:hypothetical protein